MAEYRSSLMDGVDMSYPNYVSWTSYRDMPFFPANKGSNCKQTDPPFIRSSENVQFIAESMSIDYTDPNFFTVKMESDTENFTWKIQDNLVIISSNLGERARYNNNTTEHGSKEAKLEELIDLYLNDAHGKVRSLCLSFDRNGISVFMGILSVENVLAIKSKSIEITVNKAPENVMIYKDLAEKLIEHRDVGLFIDLEFYTNQPTAEIIEFLCSQPGWVFRPKQNELEAVFTRSKREISVSYERENLSPRLSIEISKKSSTRRPTLGMPLKSINCIIQYLPIKSRFAIKNFVPWENLLPYHFQIVKIDYENIKLTIDGADIDVTSADDITNSAYEFLAESRTKLRRLTIIGYNSLFCLGNTKMEELVLDYPNAYPAEFFELKSEFNLSKLIARSRVTVQNIQDLVLCSARVVYLERSGKCALKRKRRQERRWQEMKYPIISSDTYKLVDDEYIQVKSKKTIKHRKQ